MPRGLNRYTAYTGPIHPGADALFTFTVGSTSVKGISYEKALNLADATAAQWEKFPPADMVLPRMEIVVDSGLEDTV